MSAARLPLTPTGTGRVRLTGARIIDGTGADPVSGDVIVEGDRIVHVGSGADRREGEDVVDLDGATVTPGFIDAHVHLAISLEDPPAVVAARYPSESVLYATSIVQRTLMAGVTTARDLAGLDAGYRAAVASGRILGPRLHLAIAALSPTGGHSDSHLPNGSLARTPALGGIDPIVDTDDDMRRTVRQLIRSGADVIKVCTTGGVSSPSDAPDDLGIPEHQVRIAVEETARRQGQPLAAHAQGTAGILEAIRGGISSVEHGYQIDDEGIALMLERGTVLVPTLSSALRVPDPVKVPGYLYEKKVRWSAIAREHVSRAIRAGVTVALGTDSGVCPHGRNLTELGHMVELGMDPLDAITAGTRNAARLLRLDEHVGTLETGKLADLVVTDADPLSDIGALADPDAIRVVLQGGRLVKDTDGRMPGPVAVPEMG